MKKYCFNLNFLFLLVLSSCTSLYLEEFDTPVHEGVKNYSLTDLEQSIIEMPGDQQDILVIVPKTNEDLCAYSCGISNNAKKVWICPQVDCNGNLEEGHYQVLNKETDYVVQ